ncbi:glycosyltransferase [Patescibacteria group bacterium]|nr:glycosyltransferase [Patescibacteria group bacterium]
MKILGNDYKTSIPRSNRMSHGGTASFAPLLSNFLIKNGHQWVGININFAKEKSEPTLVYEKDGKSFWDVAVPRALVLRTRNSRKKPDLKEVFKKEIEEISSLISSIKPDLVFLNGAYFKPWFLLQAAYKAKIPIIAKHAGIWKKEIEGFRSFSDPAKETFKEAERDFSKLSTVEIFLNSWSRSVYRKEVFSPKNSEVIALPIHLPKIKIKSHKNPNFNIGLVARWDAIKNHEAFLALAKECRKQNLPWEFYAVVSIPDRDVRKKEYSEYISIEPIKNKRNLSFFYQKMDLTILPSHFDVSPHVVPESIFNGTPAMISENVGWIDDYKIAQDWVADFSDIPSVIEKIKKIQNLPMPKELINTLLMRCDPESCLKKYLEVFKRVTR